MAKDEEPASAKVRASRRKIGGPPKREPKLGERVALSLRMTPELKRRLDHAAEQGGRSQSQEAEFRLERSFDRSGLLGEVTDLAFGSDLAGLLIALGSVMRSAVRTAGHDTRDEEHWVHDPVSHAAARCAAEGLLRLWKPVGLRSLSPDEAAEVARKAEQIGLATVHSYQWLFKVMRNPKSAAVLDEMVKQLAQAKGKDKS